MIGSELILTISIKSMLKARDHQLRIVYK